MAVYPTCPAKKVGKTAEASRFAEVKLSIKNIDNGTDQHSFHSPIEINRQNQEKAAPRVKWKWNATPIGPQFFTKSAFEGDTANHNHTAQMNFNTCAYCYIQWHSFCRHKGIFDALRSSLTREILQLFIKKVRETGDFFPRNAQFTQVFMNLPR